MKRIITITVFSFLCVFLSNEVHAAKRYWIKNTGAKWNNTANWSATSGGAGGASVPGASDTAYFDGNGTGNDTLDVNISIKYLSVAGGYTGTIIQGTYTVTIGTTGATLSGGTFSGGSASITVSGPLTISGCAFTSTSGTLTSSSSITYSSGSFTHNSGTIVKTGSTTISGTFSIYNLTFSATTTTTFAVSNTLTVINTLRIEGSGIVTINTGTINAQGNIDLKNTANSTTAGGTCTINVNGTGSQYINGNATRGNSRLSNVTINKASGTLYLDSTISINGNFTYTAGTISAGSSIMHFAGTKTISGSCTFTNVSFGSTGNPTYTFGAGTVVTITGELLTVGAGTVTLNTGAIHAQGNLRFSNTGNGGGGNTLITINGTSNQTLTGNNTGGQGRLPSVTINKTSGTLLLDSIISIGGNWTRTAGDVDPGASTLNMVNGKTISGTDTLNNLTFSGTGTFTISNSITVNQTLTLEGSGDITLNTGTINAKGGITLSNTGTAGGGTATVNINGSVNQLLDGSASSTQSRLPNVTINKSGGILTLQDNIPVIGNWTRTAGDTDPGSSSVHFQGTKTISGTDTLYDASFGSGIATFTISNTLNVLGTLSINGNIYSQTLNTGTINAYGDVTTTNTATGGGGTATIKLVGSGSQILTGSGTTGGGRLCNITIDKSSGTLSLSSIISVNGHWNYIKGDVDPSNSSVALYGSYNLDGQQEGMSTMMRFYNLAVGTGTRTLTGNLDINNNFTISSGATCDANGNNMNVAGNWNCQGTFTYGTGTVMFDGSSYNTIKGASGTTVGFGNVAFNRGSGSVTLQNPMRVNTSMNITKGRIKTTTTNYLEFIDNATCTTASHSAYVHGPVRKTGNDAFTFPLGDTTLNDTAAFHPLGITAPGVATDQFEAEYRAVTQTIGDSLVDSLSSLSNNEYWRLNRNSGSSNVYVTISWNTNSSFVQDYNLLRVSGWDGNKWANLGNSATTISGYTGSISSAITPSFPSNTAYITISKKINTTQYAVLHRELDGGYYLVRNGALYFMYDEEYYDTDNNLSYKIYNEGREIVGSSDGSYPTSLTLSNVHGDNRFFLNLLSCNMYSGGYINSGIYILDVYNEKGEHLYLRFKHITTIAPVCPGNNNNQ
jgi:hypothetical protein